MQFLNLVVVLSVLAGVAANSKSFGGSNNYFIHGVSDYEREQWVNTLADWGAKVVRLWGNVFWRLSEFIWWFSAVVGLYDGCVKGSKTSYIQNLENEGSIGTYHPEVLHALDNVLSLLHKRGMKAIISPHDGGSIGGANGCDAYCKKYWNSDNFYSNQSAKNDYDNRMAYILNYQSPNFGKKWSQLSEAILAFDIQNEVSCFTVVCTVVCVFWSWTSRRIDTFRVLKSVCYLSD